MQSSVVLLISGLSEEVYIGGRKIYTFMRHLFPHIAYINLFSS